MSQPAPQLKTISVAMIIMGVLVEIFAIVRIGMEGKLGTPSLLILVSGTMLITLGVLFLVVINKR